MISTRGFSAVLNDDITSIVLTFVCVLNSLLVSSVAMVIASMFGSSISVSTYTAAVWVGYCIAAIVASVVESGVATVYVCFMEEASALKISHEEAYNSLASAWMVMYGAGVKGGVSVL